MDLIADILLVAGALGAAVYCVVLSRRLSRFTDLEGGVGGAVATLAAQVDEMARALERSRRAAEGQSGTLERSTRRAEEVARRLELLVASLHDLPEEGAAARASPRPPVRPEAPPEPAAAPERADATAAGRAPDPASSPAPGPSPDAGPAPSEVARGPVVTTIREAAVPPAAPEPRPAPGWASDAAAWDDWDPFEVAPDPAPRDETVDPAARTPAPERAIRAGADERPGAGPRSEAAPEPEAAPARPMPIFTASRPAIRPVPAARHLAVGE